MKILVLIVFLLVLGVFEPVGSTNVDAVCRFDFDAQTSCEHGDYRIDIRSTPVADDEIRLLSLEVTYRGKKYSLKISPDTTLLKGDQGFISFEDINFDEIPDVAISTSFGVANLYMDYWIFSCKKNDFKKIGNYSRFSIDPANKTLRNNVKLNAAAYENNVYSWQGSKLIKQKK